MYTRPAFKTKKELKEAVKQGVRVEAYSPGPFGGTFNGSDVIEGPEYPKPHRWYASVEIQNGLVVKVK